MRKSFICWAFLLNVAAFGFMLQTATDAASVNTRADLNSLLGVYAVTEDFETLNVPNADIRAIVGPLNTNTMALGQGPGLVVPGVTFSYPNPGNGFLNWLGAGYFGQLSRDLCPNGTAGAMVVDFDPVITAVGFDLSAFAGFPSSANIQILAPDHTTVLSSTTIPVSDPSAPAFFGFSRAEGIGRVRLGSFGQPSIIDNLTFGAVPDPVSFNGHIYKLSSQRETWAEAEAEAVALGGHLVAINSQAENDFLVATFLSSPPAPSPLRPLWIGLTDAAVEGTFLWSNGDPLTYVNWGAGEPNNNGGNEDYGTIGWISAFTGNDAFKGAWNDAPLAGTAFGHEPSDGPYQGIIELVIPEPSGAALLLAGSVLVGGARCRKFHPAKNS